MSKKKLSPENKKNAMALLRNFSWSMFTGGTNVFDMNKVPTQIVDEFINSDEFFDEAYEFTNKILRLWRKNYPDKPMKLVKLSPTSARTPILHIFPEFISNQKPLPESPVISQLRELSEGACVSLNSEINDGSLAPNKTSSDANSKKINNSSLENAVKGEPPLAVNPLKPGQVPVAVSPTVKPSVPPPTFHLPNAKIGVEYCAKIVGSSSSGVTVDVVSVNIPPELGLSFVSGTGELAGTPLKDGDYKIPLQWKDGNTSYSGFVLLLVNPDPKSLWKIIEPAADSIYPKAHLDQSLIKADNYSIAAASRRGRSHEHAGSHRDDDFFITHDQESAWSVMIVADGAGSAKCSRYGSKLAVDVAGKYIKENLLSDFGVRMTTALDGWYQEDGTAKSMGEQFYYLFHKAGELAVKAIEQEAKENNFSPKDYSTTFLAAVVKKVEGETFLATFWIGDGAIAAYGPRGSIRLMGTPDSGEYAGQTRFLDRSTLSDPGCAKRGAVGRYADIKSVILMTDGVSDPRFETDNGLADAKRWDALWDEIKPCLDATDPEVMLVDWLNFFSQGNHDDRTIALLW